MTITQWHVPIDDDELLLVRDLHQLRRAGRQGRRCATSASSSTSCPTTCRARTRPTTTASTRTSRRPRPTPAWATTSTSTTSGRCESMGAIQDRTREHLGTSDKAIVALPPAAAAGDRQGRLRRQADAVPRRRRSAQHPGSRHHRRHRPDRRAGKPTGWKSTSSAGAARRGPHPCRQEIADKVRQSVQGAFCRSRTRALVAEFAPILATEDVTR